MNNFFSVFVRFLPVAADNVADVVEDIVCIVDKLVDVCCEFNSIVLDIVADDADCCCDANAGSSVKRNAISKSRSTSVSLDSINEKRLWTKQTNKKKK